MFILPVIAWGVGCVTQTSASTGGQSCICFNGVMTINRENPHHSFHKAPAHFKDPCLVLMQACAETCSVRVSLGAAGRSALIRSPLSAPKASMSGTGRALWGQGSLTPNTPECHSPLVLLTPLLSPTDVSDWRTLLSAPTEVLRNMTHSFSTTDKRLPSFSSGVFPFISFPPPTTALLLLPGLPLTLHYSWSSTCV